MIAAVVLIVQVCLAPTQGGVLLQGCQHRLVEAEDCGQALAFAEALAAPDRVVVPGGCVPMVPPSRRLPEPPRR